MRVSHKGNEERGPPHACSGANATCSNASLTRPIFFPFLRVLVRLAKPSLEKRFRGAPRALGVLAAVFAQPSSTHAGTRLSPEHIADERCLPVNRRTGWRHRPGLRGRLKKTTIAEQMRLRQRHTFEAARFPHAAAQIQRV